MKYLDTPFVQTLIVVVLAPLIVIAGAIGALFLPCGILALQGAVFTLLWNYALVVIFHAPHLNFLQGIATVWILRLIAALFRRSI